MPEIIPNWHPLFVHFSVALLSLTVLLHLLAHFSSGQLQSESRIVARWTLWLGALAAVVTGVAGIIAYNSVAHDTPSHLAMTEHRNLALPTIALFVILAVWGWLQHRKGRLVGLVFLTALAAGGVLLASTAWHGAELVYRHGLGVMSLPKVGDHDHAGHAHGDEALEQDHEGLEAGHHHDDLGAADMMGEEPSDEASPDAHHQDGRDHQH